MPRLSALRVGILSLVLVGLVAIVWFAIGSRRTPRPTTSPTNRPATITGLLGQANGLFSLVEGPAKDPIYLANSHDAAVNTLLAPLIGQTVTVSGTFAVQDVDTFYLTSVNNQAVSPPVSQSPAPGLRDVFANLPTKQQQCLTTQFDAQVLSSLLADPAYQLTASQTETLTTCLNQTGGSL